PDTPQFGVDSVGKCAGQRHLNLERVHLLTMLLAHSRPVFPDEPPTNGAYRDQPAWCSGNGLGCHEILEVVNLPERLHHLAQAVDVLDDVPLGEDQVYWLGMTGEVVQHAGQIPKERSTRLPLD